MQSRKNLNWSVRNRLILFYGVFFIFAPYLYKRHTTGFRKLTTMFSSHTFLWLYLVIITTKSGAFLLNEHANTSVGHPDNGNYNIYSKIDALERTLQSLETSVREKTTHSDTLMRQVLLTVNEMDVKLESSDLRNMSLEMKKIQYLVRNISGKSCLLLIVYGNLLGVGFLEGMRQNVLSITNLKLILKYRIILIKCSCRQVAFFIIHIQKYGRQF